MKAIWTSLSVCAALGIVAGFAADSSVDKGKQVFQKNGCANCHRVNGAGRGRAPDLATSAKRTDAFLDAQIINARTNNPRSKMPSFNKMSKTDRADLIAYLQSLHAK